VSRPPARPTAKKRAAAKAAPAATAPEPPPDAAAAPTPSREIESYAGDPNFMMTLARGLAVIRAFTQQRRRPTIAQLSMKTGIPRAAVRRCLYTLSQLGYVASDDGRSFALRPRILALGHAYLTSSPLASSAQPILDTVSDAVHESCSMAILEGDDILYIARSRTSTRIMSIDLGVGSRLPAYCTSMGRMLLAGLEPRELAAYFARIRCVPYTERTLTAPEKVRQQVAKARADGFAIVDQELEIGLRSIGVPVKDAHGRIVAAINISVQASRVTIADMETKFRPPLEVAAHELGMLLS
jgi:IclR family pca regulon transcriptional regulator